MAPAESRTAACRRTLIVLQPIAHHLAAAVVVVDTFSELFDGDPPFHPLGCIAKNWSVEVLRSSVELSRKPCGSIDDRGY
ncbi:MAG: hypothetical protein ACKOYH_00415 [Cyanobium sp.]